ncbi:cytochrome c biogenesis heme-transporting ATPase CcmA [Paraglaciecola aquimarina]|uniref:Cytochrome c biogenesis heme-transporting ATPase CcmA n=1 Tax=Paraglaciecola aquimarina TaxID=1235557 RepID=A0ABU3T1J4_9ALTE|nr:cytochrome c biogenesis heme-transporting ATPase CcmA [Paraglaciecola aquimarina]MDU0356136.1 cytochrome c biogenesis heme-transporting ATPase CcmA [Paraglaciecola aquimarina]
MAVLSTYNLSVVKRDRLLFEQVNISVQQGALLYVKGPNGAGKTSLLRVLTGLVAADSGDVLFEQQNIKECAQRYQQQLIYFGHKLGVNHTLSAVENLRFWCAVHNVKVSDTKIYEVLELLGLVGLEDVAVGSLSAGQQRRTALARFWLKTESKLWILDEPFTALDTQGIRVLSQKLVEYLSQGGAVIMTSHQSLELDYPTQELTLEYRI